MDVRATAQHLWPKVRLELSPDKLVFNAMHGFAHPEKDRLEHDIRGPALRLGKKGASGEQVERVMRRFNALASQIASSSIETAKKSIAALCRQLVKERLEDLPRTLLTAKKKATAKLPAVACELAVKCRDLNSILSVADDAECVHALPNLLLWYFLLLVAAIAHRY